MADTPGEEQRYEVLYEDIKHDVQLVLEGHSVLRGKMDRVADESESRDVALNRQFDLGISTLVRKLDALSQKLDQIGDAVLELSSTVKTGFQAAAAQLEAHQRTHAN